MAAEEKVNLVPLSREGTLEQRVAELEDMLDAVRNEVALLKKFDWGKIEDPPTVKKEIC